MCDFRCPTCDGGFPASADTDQCPWCGETMDALDDTSAQADGLSSLPNDRFGVGERGPRPRGFEREERISTDPLVDDCLGLRPNGSANSLFDDDRFNSVRSERTGEIYRTTPSDRTGRTERLSNRLDEAREPEKADAAVAYLHDPNATMRDVAEQFDRSQSWVSQAVQEYRDSEGDADE